MAKIWKWWVDGVDGWLAGGWVGGHLGGAVGGVR
jgi:hypothetical protein